MSEKNFNKNYSDLIKSLRIEKNLTQQGLADHIGVNKKTIQNWEHGLGIPSTKLKKIIELAESNEKVKSHFVGMMVTEKKDKDKEQPVTPLYDVTATCGFDGNLSGGYLIGQISVPNMPKCDGAIHVTGDSMYPLLKSGDIVAYKVVHELQMVSFGEVYIVQYEMGGDRTICVKYVKKSDDDNKLKLVSYNKEFDPVEISKESVTFMARVMFSIRQMAIM